MGGGNQGGGGDPNIIVTPPPPVSGDCQPDLTMLNSPRCEQSIKFMISFQNLQCCIFPFRTLMDLQLHVIKHY